MCLCLTSFVSTEVKNTICYLKTKCHFSLSGNSTTPQYAETPPGGDVCLSRIRYHGLFIKNKMYILNTCKLPSYSTFRIHTFNISWRCFNLVTLENLYYLLITYSSKSFNSHVKCIIVFNSALIDKPY